MKGDERTKILRRIADWSSGPEEARRWYASFPIPALGHKTAAELVDAGRGRDLLDYLEVIECGGFQ